MATKKKPTKKSAASRKKKPTSKSKTATKKSSAAKKSKKKPIHSFDNRTRARHISISENLHSLPVIDFKELVSKTKPAKKVGIRSRLAFYLGAFLGAVVIQALLVSLLVIFSV